MTTPSGRPSSSTALPAGTVSAWQSALAAEHAAVFGYGSLGPHLPDAEQATARAYQQAHVALRDTAVAALTGRHIDPVRAAADYPGTVVRDAAAARALALRLEDDAAAAWRYLVARAAGTAPTALVTGAVADLGASALRALTWRSALTPSAPFDAFPGI